MFCSLLNVTMSNQGIDSTCFGQNYILTLLYKTISLSVLTVQMDNLTSVTCLNGDGVLYTEQAQVGYLASNRSNIGPPLEMWNFW